MLGKEGEDVEGEQDNVT